MTTLKSHGARRHGRQVPGSAVLARFARAHMLSLAAAATALLVPSLMTRRSVLAACGLAATATPKLASAKSDFKWGPLAQMTEAQMDALDEASREPSAGVLLPSGVRVIDMVVGDGPEPAAGKRVYCHYKV